MTRGRPPTAGCRMREWTPARPPASRSTRATRSRPSGCCRPIAPRSRLARASRTSGRSSRAARRSSRRTSDTSACSSAAATRVGLGPRCGSSSARSPRGGSASMASPWTRVGPPAARPMAGSRCSPTEAWCLRATACSSRWCKRAAAASAAKSAPGGPTADRPAWPAAGARACRRSPRLPCATRSPTSVAPGSSAQGTAAAGPSRRRGRASTAKPVAPRRVRGGVRRLGGQSPLRRGRLVRPGAGRRCGDLRAAAAPRGAVR